jgi:hypothetical protein
MGRRAPRLLLQDCDLLLQGGHFAHQFPHDMAVQYVRNNLANTQSSKIFRSALTQTALIEAGNEILDFILVRCLGHLDARATWNSQIPVAQYHTELRVWGTTQHVAGGDRCVGPSREDTIAASRSLRERGRADNFRGEQELGRGQDAQDQNGLRGCASGGTQVCRRGETYSWGRRRWRARRRRRRRHGGHGRCETGCRGAVQAVGLVTECAARARR